MAPDNPLLSSQINSQINPQLDIQSLPTPAVYFPIERGLYEVGPGLKALGTDFGNGDLDRRIIQVDSDFSRYLQEKRAARKENLDKYFGVSNLPVEVERSAVRRLIEAATQENPEVFSANAAPSGEREVLSRLTGETLHFSPSDELVNIVTAPGSLAPDPAYRSGLDALISQFQEDVAIVSSDGAKNWISMLHVSFPSHWAPGEKLGRDFAQVHQPVPGIERMNRNQAGLVDAMIRKGPFVRFVWSFVTDTRLNHHPEAPEGFDPQLWRGRAFDESRTDQAPFYLRVERQITLGLPDTSSALFFIRLSFIDGRMLKSHPIWSGQLLSALRSMSPESRVYKGLSHCFDSLVNWLASS